MKREPLRILVAIQYYLPHRTGVPIHVQRVAEALVKRGHSVTVLTARHDDSLPWHEEMNGVRIIRLWAPIGVSRGRIMPFFPLHAWRLMEKHHLVWLQTPMLETSLLSLLSRLRGKRLVATHHGDLILPPGMLNRFIQWFTFLQYRFFAKRAFRLIAYSEDYADNSYYLRPFRDKVKVIHPPIEIPRPRADRVAMLRSRWQHEGGPVIGYAGRFVREKRPDLLIRSLEVINRRYPNARIVFAGQYDIPYEDTWTRARPLVRRYQDQLLFLGRLESMEDMADFYAACDVLVMPSDTECFALVQVEAMLCGTPVVMTDTPGGRVPVKVTGMGRIVPVGDWRAMGRAVLEILDSPASFKKPAERIRASFDIGETVSQYERCFYEASSG